MSKLFNLKSRFSLEDAAKHLTTILAEEVCITDILRLAIDGYLILSLNLINNTESIQGFSVDKGKAQVVLSDKIKVPWVKDESIEPRNIIMSPEISDTEYFVPCSWKFISGLFYLRLTDGVKRILENEYQKLTEGSELEWQLFDCVYLEGHAGEIYTLLSLGKKMVETEFEGEDGWFTSITSEGDIDPLSADLEDYYQASDLPEGSVICITSDSLQSFVHQIAHKDKGVVRESASCHPRTEDSDDKVQVQELADRAARHYFQTNKRYPTKVQISKILYDGGLLLKRNGEALSQDTIDRRFKANWLKG